MMLLHLLPAYRQPRWPYANAPGRWSHARSHGRGRARKRDERRELARAWGSAPAVSSSAGHQVWALCVCAACAPPIARTRSAVDAGQAPTPSASARNFSEG